MKFLSGRYEALTIAALTAGAYTFAYLYELGVTSFHRIPISWIEISTNTLIFSFLTTMPLFFFVVFLLRFKSADTKGRFYVFNFINLIVVYTVLIFLISFATEIPLLFYAIDPFFYLFFFMVIAFGYASLLNAQMSESSLRKIAARHDTLQKRTRVYQRLLDKIESNQKITDTKKRSLDSGRKKLARIELQGRDLDKDLRELYWRGCLPALAFGGVLILIIPLAIGFFGNFNRTIYLVPANEPGWAVVRKIDNFIVLRSYDPNSSVWTDALSIVNLSEKEEQSLIRIEIENQCKLKWMDVFQLNLTRPEKCSNGNEKRQQSTQ